MSNHETLNLGRRFRETLWSEDRPEDAANLVAPQCKLHGLIPFSTDFSSGPEAIRQLIAFYQLTFSDIRMTVERTVVEGDLVAVHWSARGRHTGDLLGVPPTGREVRVSGIDLLQVRDGRIAEAWFTWDAVALLQQLFGPSDGSDTSPDLLSAVEKLSR